MQDKQYYRFRVDLVSSVSDKYKKIAKESGVSVPTLLKIVLTEATKKEIVIKVDDQ